MNAVRDQIIAARPARKSCMADLPRVVVAPERRRMRGPRAPASARERARARRPRRRASRRPLRRRALPPAGADERHPEPPDTGHSKPHTATSAPRRSVSALAAASRSSPHVRGAGKPARSSSRCCKYMIGVERLNGTATSGACRPPPEVRALGEAGHEIERSRAPS